ncbi:hypothetical protein DD595_25950 [Enterobacter cloacae complex sp. 4DZ3-17B2]|uniref:hypothetical protein n=1 Tax=Enterobacter cloacae complex sp. 4DZ3-17B2 TaxID=2511990 RepID=UPI0010134307|nr:hypothetical protein [Enterobacter cloacae complex sp. 4DZ3-17B2]RYA67810.1 hypothetical protein DD595_25950 [Enterobacter cloacae complex sp. 4DZ3-17B2]
MEEIRERAHSQAAAVVPDEHQDAITLYGVHAEDLQNETEDMCLNEELYIDIGSYAELCEDEREIS